MINRPWNSYATWGLLILTFLVESQAEVSGEQESTKTRSWQLFAIFESHSSRDGTYDILCWKIPAYTVNGTCLEIKK